MRILALIGNPRKGGNTDRLVEQILTNSRVKGHATEKLFLYDYEIAPCVDCRNCQKSNGQCSINDGMRDIYPKIENADIIIFATPLYWYGPSGKMKLLIDRMRPYLTNKKLVGRKGLLVVPSEEGPNACRPLLQMFRKSFAYLGIEYAGKVFVRAYEKEEVHANKEALKRADEIANSL